MERADSPEVTPGWEIGRDHVIGAGDALNEENPEVAAEIRIGIDVEIVADGLGIRGIGPIKRHR